MRFAMVGVLLAVTAAPSWAQSKFPPAQGKSTPTITKEP